LLGTNIKAYYKK